MRLSEITKDQIKGITTALKSCKKDYPFINGFFFDKDNDKYENVLFIILTIDFKEVSKFYSLEVKNELYKSSSGFYTSFGIPFDWGIYGSDEWNLKLEYWINEKEKVQKMFNIGIRSLPSKYSFRHNPSIHGYCQGGSQCVKDNIDSTYGEVFPV